MVACFAVHDPVIFLTPGSSTHVKHQTFLHPYQNSTTKYLLTFFLWFPNTMIRWLGSFEALLDISDLSRWRSIKHNQLKPFEEVLPSRSSFPSAAFSSSVCTFSSTKQEVRTTQAILVPPQQTLQWSTPFYSPSHLFLEHLVLFSVFNWCFYFYFQFLFLIFGSVFKKLSLFIKGMLLKWMVWQIIACEIYQHCFFNWWSTIAISEVNFCSNLS